MFTSEAGKQIGDRILSHAPDIRNSLAAAFETSIVGVGSEVTFFRNLLSRIKTNLETLHLPDVSFTCRLVETHQKPRVAVTHPRIFSCELADLLIVIKYRIGPEIVEKASQLYQVKLCKWNSEECTIDQNQLELLSDWPPFEFGRLAQGGVRQYRIRPKTLEFGSYMLMLRSPLPRHYVKCQSHFCNFQSYGVSPHALAVRRLGPSSVNISTFPFALSSSDAFFNHLALERGEHNSLNPEINDLVAALYRHLGLDPDPPGEFDGFLGKPLEDEPGFAILEIAVNGGEQSGGSGVRKMEKEVPPRKDSGVKSDRKK